MKKFKVLVTIFLVLAVMLNVGFIMFNANVDEANAYILNSWDLVDSGKHLDWDSNSSYIDTWLLSVNVWNGIHNIIRPDSWKWVQDVYVSDYYAEDDVVAYTSSWNKIKFNTFFFNSMNSAERQKTQMHEIGHALGLDENNNVVGSIMRQGIREQTTLLLDDVDGFHYLYNNVY